MFPTLPCRRLTPTINHFFLMKLVAAVRGPAGIYTAVHVGSRAFIHMPGDHVLSGTLEHYGRRQQYTGGIPFFHVQLPHDSLTADLVPFPVSRGSSSHRVIDYRCFIPISGYRVLVAFLEPHIVENYDHESALVAIRLPMENNTLYSGFLHIGEGEGPAWIPRHM